MAKNLKFQSFILNQLIPETFKWIKKLNPDLILCIGWSEIIKTKILRLPRYGVFGYHPAKLPYNKGRHPIIWSLVLGLKETASTFIKLDKGVDTGAILDQKIIKIPQKYTSQDLYDKLIKISKIQQ